jgi:two-component system, chemotaxis family, CheB/CheR fusion protein
MSSPPQPNGQAVVTATSPRVPVVGIGASAGGIRALQDLFGALPAHPGAAMVVIVHLDPSHASELASILQLRTVMPVTQVNGRVPLEADHVYVIPPDRRLLISGSDIATAPFEERRGQRAPIDLFFRSLAAEHGDGWVVVLTGSGSDGSVGVRAVKEHGGIILVQDPAEAEYPMMPRAAIAAGADFVLPLSGIATQLVQLIRAKAEASADPADAGDEEMLRRILAHIRAKTGQDFASYKRATVSRRILRRMQVVQTDKLGSYFAYLRSHPEEVQALFNDLLISVTSFFRDAQAYTALAERVIPGLSDRDPGQPIRVWVPGCATGEEAYSIAILLLEEAARRDTRHLIQVFASDLDAGALATARAGRYPTAIAADVSAERLARFFTLEGDHYVVRPELRDLVVFAVHGLLKDPPFSRLDLISCRNLMIYLERDLQEQACRTFAYALSPRGHLFLGSSETADHPPGLFAVVDREARIYRVNEQSARMLPPLPSVLLPAPLNIAVEAQSKARAPPSEMLAHRQALEELAPPSMLVDQDQSILNLSETAGHFLQPPGGRVTSDAAAMVRPELRFDLTAALHRAFEHDERTVTLPIPVRFNGTPQAVALQVSPRTSASGVRTALVLFVKGGPAPDSAEIVAPPEASPLVVRLREELLGSRAHLRTTREQYEAATEELRAANEELQSINEEYRSTAEELETSKEELQSINEELQTLNNELKLKLDMVARSNNDLQNLMGASDIATLFLDKSMRIKRFTPRTTELFSIHAGDEGRPVSDFTHRLEYGDLVADAERVLADLIPIERSIHTLDDRWLTTRLRPYRTIDDKIEGVVVTFFDVTEKRNADAEWAARQDLLLKEFGHRVKNTLAVVQAIVRQTLKGKSVPNDPGLADRLCDRLRALALSHDLLVKSEWKQIDLRTLARSQLAALIADDRLEIGGEALSINAEIATPLGLVLHELATNAVKYGALRSEHGRVALSWSKVGTAEEGVLEIVWRERGGPPVTAPDHKGLGTTLIEQGVKGGRAECEYDPLGVTWKLKVPVGPSADSMHEAADIGQGREPRRINSISGRG